MRRGERPNFPIIGPWEKMLVGSPWGMWRRHPGIISIVESIPTWLQLACFGTTQAELECVADSLSSWSGTEAEVSSLCVSYCILPLPGRSPGLRVVYIISTVPWAQCKQFRVSVINTHRISPATARPGCPVWLSWPWRVTGPPVGKRWGKDKSRVFRDTDLIWWHGVTLRVLASSWLSPFLSKGL